VAEGPNVRKHGVAYEPAEQNKSQIYGELLPLLNSGRIELLDHTRLAAQLCNLERRTSRGGRDSIDHPPHAHDDLANAASGALVACAGEGAALWQRSALPVVAAPSHVGLVYCVLCSDKLAVRAGAVYFAVSKVRGSAVCILDCELAPLTPALLYGVCTRLVDLSAACLAVAPAMLFTTSALTAELERLGYLSEIIDGLLKDEMLAVAAAVHVSAQRVRVCADVLAKSYPLTFLQGAAVHDDDDPLRIAFLAGVAVALDTNRSLGRATA
jgi:hypothetical protein